MNSSKGSLGIIEYRSIAGGMKAADGILKAGQVELLFAKPMCPGKYVVAITGKLAAITGAIEAGRGGENEGFWVDDCIIGNPDPQLFSGLYLNTNVEGVEAVGIVESFSVASIFEAADEVVNTSQVNILEIRIAKGLSGKAYVTFSGDVASVSASVEKASKIISQKGMMLSTAVIPNPDPRLWEELV